MSPAGRLLARGVVTLALLSALPGLAVGQVLRGVLSERDTYTPIPLGILTLTGVEGDTISQGLSDEEGFYEFETPGPGTYYLIAAAPGYRAVRSEPQVVADETVKIVELTMAIRPIPVEGIVIEAEYEEPERTGLAATGFYERANQGGGERIWPGQILNSTAKYVQPLFWHSKIARVMQMSHDRPGPWNDEIVLRRQHGIGGIWCSPALYIDGIWVQELNPGESIADAVPIGELMAVEMYQWPHDVPYEYQGNMDCGVILFWTQRYGGA